MKTKNFLTTALTRLYMKLVMAEWEHFVLILNWFGTGMISTIVAATLLLIIYNLVR